MLLLGLSFECWETGKKGLHTEQNTRDILYFVLEPACELNSESMSYAEFVTEEHSTNFTYMLV